MSPGTASPAECTSERAFDEHPSAAPRRTLRHLPGTGLPPRPAGPGQKTTHPQGVQAPLTEGRGVMDPFYCAACGHWQKQHTHCTAITHNETGGAQRCGCHHEQQPEAQAA